MNITSIIMALVIGGGVFVGYLLLVQFSSRRESVKNRVGKLASAYASAAEAESDIVRQNELTPMAAMLEGILEVFGTDVEGLRREQQVRLAQGGIGSRSNFVQYLFLKRIGLPIFAIVGLIPVVLGFKQASSNMIAAGFGISAVLLVIIGIKGADIFLLNRIQKRKAKLIKGFPDMLDLLLVCVESGLALDGALNRVTRELGRSSPEITEELNRTRLELTLLNDRSQALQNLADRTDLVPFKALVSALIQSEKFGTSLADTLRVMSHDYRITRLLKAEEKAGRLPAMMTVPMILLMLPAFLMIIIAPPIIRVVAQGGLFGGH